MDIIVWVAMECHKHQVGLDSNKGMDILVWVAMECHKHQVGLDSNKGMDIIVKVARVSQAIGRPGQKLWYWQGFHGVS